MVDRPEINETGPIQVYAEEENITFEEFLVKYAGVHAEWIGGKVEVIVTNNSRHSFVLTLLTLILGNYLSFKRIAMLLLAGVPMRIGGQARGREPDLLIVLDDHKDRILPTYLNGPADIAVEVVSPESVDRDYSIKLAEYEQAGVPEYWIFDPAREIADVYRLHEDGHYRRLNKDAEGRLVSTLLPGFALDPAILWRDELPEGAALVEMVQAMVKS